MLKKAINKILRRFGYRVSRLAALPVDSDAPDRFLSIWAERGGNPSFMIDIGANHGRWTRKALRSFPDAKVLMIEPQERLRVYSQDILAGNKAHWKTAGIADVIGSMTLSMPDRDDSASFAISGERALAMGYEQVDVPVTTIDALVAEAGQIPNIIKIDAEGFDLKALKGASSILGKTEVVLVECAIVAPGLDNTMENVFQLLWSKGYKLFDVTDLNYSPNTGLLWLGEFVFVHSSSPIWNGPKEY